MSRPALRIAAVAALGALAALALAGCFRRPHNVVLFVADGLRSGVVDARTAPELEAVREEGVDFADSHSLFPTLTTPNASAITTGRRLGDTGDFANMVFAGAPALGPASGSLVAPLEDDPALAAMNARFGGNYLGADGLLAEARRRGYQTAVIGKLGPARVIDVAADPLKSLIIDDETGADDGLQLPTAVAQAIKAAGLAPAAPDRGLNTDPGDFMRAGAHVANVQQQDWFTEVATRVVLPMFKSRGRPFVLVFWSRDPDGSQHNEGDSLNTLSPGINGPTSLAGVANASRDLGRLRAALKALDLESTTDVIVTADHGFSTASKESATSAAAKLRYRDVPPGFLPPGFLAIDLARALGLPLHDGAGLDVGLADGFHPRGGGALLGADPARPEVVIASNGGSDQIWLPGPDARALVPRITAALEAEDYVGGIFVDDALGPPPPGALPMSAVGLTGSARTPRPSIIVSFRSFAGTCGRPEVCGIEVADTSLQQGQGIHGAFSRADTHNFMAAVGPDFRARWRDPAPVSNADLAATIAAALGWTDAPTGDGHGRAASESLRRGPPPPAVRRSRLVSAPGAGGFVTVLARQSAGGRDYYDAAGAPTRTLGLAP